MKKSIKICIIVMLIMILICILFAINIFNVRNYVSEKTGIISPVPKTIYNLRDIEKMGDIELPEYGEIDDSIAVVTSYEAIDRKEFDITYCISLKIPSTEIIAYNNYFSGKYEDVVASEGSNLTHSEKINNIITSGELKHLYIHKYRITNEEYSETNSTHIYIIDTGETMDTVCIVLYK